LWIKCVYTGVSVSELVRKKFVRITNHLRGSRYPNSERAIKVRIPRRLCIRTGVGVSVSEQFGYRDPSVLASAPMYSSNQLSISSTFYARIFRTKVLFSSYILAKKKTLSYEKHALKMFMKLTPVPFHEIQFFVPALIFYNFSLILILIFWPNLESIPIPAKTLE
jgi:hypothetical protein